VLTAVAIVPSAPVLVPELAGGAVAELDDLRAAMVAAARELPARWLAIGAADADAVIGAEAAGTFAGYGVDVPVRLGPRAGAEPAPLPLAALITGWLRGLAAPDAVARVRVFDRRTRCAAALAAGRALRAELDRDPEPVGVLVVADGAHTLTPAAPGGHDPASVPVQRALAAALAAGDTAALAELPDAIVGRVAYQVAAGLIGTPRVAEQRWHGAPYGVGYFCGVWRP